MSFERAWGNTDEVVPADDLEGISANELSQQFETQLGQAETKEELLAAFTDVIQKGIDLGIDQDEIVYKHPEGGVTPVWSLEGYAKGYLEAALVGDEERLYTGGDVGLPPEFKAKALVLSEAEQTLDKVSSKQELVGLALETTTDLFNEKVVAATTLEEVQQIYLDAIKHWQEYKIQDDQGAEVKDYDGSGMWIALSLPNSYNALERLDFDLKSNDEVVVENAPNKYRFIPAVVVRKLAELNGKTFEKV